MKKIDKKELHIIFDKMNINKELYFNKLYENYRNLIYGIAFSILKNSEDSEDVVQKVYTKIWNIESKKLPKNNEASWLYTLTKNEALDFYKVQKNLLNIEDIYYLSDENKEINEIIDKDYYNRIISKLNTQEQEIISLKLLSNISFKEIAEILNIPEGTVKWKYYKAIHTLKLLLVNLGMFIITFVISLKEVIFNQKKSSQMPEDKQENIIVPDTSTTSSEQSKSENQESHQYQNTADSFLENTTEQVIIQEPVNANNYFKIGIVGASIVFLIFTVIFSIIFAKHQLKRKHKSSK